MGFSLSGLCLGDETLFTYTVTDRKRIMYKGILLSEQISQLRIPFQESILRNFDFSGFPIFGVKLESL